MLYNFKLSNRIQLFQINSKINKISTPVHSKLTIIKEGSLNNFEHFIWGGHCYKSIFEGSFEKSIQIFKKLKS